MMRIPIDPTLLAKDKIIHYLVPLSEQPTVPNKTWRGRILFVHLSIRAVLVESLEPGYEGCKEMVFIYQIIVAS